MIRSFNTTYLLSLNRPQVRIAVLPWGRFMQVGEVCMNVLLFDCGKKEEIGWQQHEISGIIAAKWLLS